MDSIHNILKQYWRFDAFRPFQEEIIHSVLGGRDTLALLPTGGGKSICYQVPAMAMDGLCLVVSPLIALMKDQVENLRRKNITAFAIYSGMARKEVINTLKVASASNCKFLYVSPERLETGLFKEYLPALDIRLLAIDEAHCISQWGYDFRPPYLRIAALREDLPGVPVLALTATATPEVQQDICEKLLFQQPSIFRQSFARENLSFSVFQVASKINKIVEILKNLEGSSVIYCRTRKKCREISDLLNMHGFSAEFYHAGLKAEERSLRQENWKTNKTRVIVCTNAFGMGIDKPDVRAVIHADLPDCIENYYQEAGRAGRDLKRAYAVLLYGSREPDELRAVPDTRFPGIDKIRTVYRDLANYLQVPSGSGEGQYFDFDMPDFISKFKLNTYEALYSLKALEQEELLSFNEQVFLPARVGFTTDRASLNAFELEYPDLMPLVQALLRTYSGIFDQPVAIFIKSIAFLLKKDSAEIEKGLLRLQALRLIEYIPQKENPQLYFIQPRMQVSDLRINQENYKRRKQQLEKRIAAFLDYVKEEHECRSRLMATYFGDDGVQPCGICDNCLREKNSLISEAEFEFIHQQILAWTNGPGIPAHDLISKLDNIRKEKIWKVIQHLQAENRLHVDKKGLITAN